MTVNFNSFCLTIGGGNRTILELADGLAERGHNVSVTHMGAPSYYSWYGKTKCTIHNFNFNILLRAFKKYYLKPKGFDYNLSRLMTKFIPECDVNVATAYDTVYPTFFSTCGNELVYLVQHYEPWFYDNDATLAAKAFWTYQLPFRRFCVSRWLTEKVDGEFLGNGVNLNKFYLMNLNREYDVMVIPRPSVSWKGNYAKIVNKLESAGYSVLSIQNMNDETLVRCYNKSKVFLYLSSMKEGFGLAPLEAMACGCAVISTPCTEYLVDKKNCLLLKEESQLLKHLQTLNDKSFREELVANGLATAVLHDFNDVVDRFEDLVY